MSIKKHLATLRDLSTMAMDLGLLRYPSFVYGRSLRKGECPPVLCLHTGLPSAFEDWCRYLADNGIVTLDADEYADRVEGKTPSKDREVFLTFDDGHLSVWSVIEPMFRKYGLKGTTFLIPGRMPPEVPPEVPLERARGPSGPLPVLRPTMDDVWAQRATERDITEPLKDGYTLATWAEDRAMHERGVMDFQCHTLHHRLVVVSDTIVGFVTPELAKRVHPFELAMLASKPGEQPTSDIVMPALGTPIYASASRMSSQRACFPCPDVAAACVETVEEQGNSLFFDRPDWDATLRKLAQKHHKPAAFETPQQQRDAIANDLRECRRLIEEHLPDKPARHLAYPWGVGSDLSTQAAREAGYRTAHWGRVEQRLNNRVGTDPLKLARIGEDFFTLLPGKGRASLMGVLSGKLTSRWKRGSPYVSH